MLLRHNGVGACEVGAALVVGDADDADDAGDADVVATALVDALCEPDPDLTLEQPLSVTPTASSTIARC